MACAAMGVSRASVLRRRAALRTLTVGPRPRARPARALTIPQTQAVLEVLHAPIFVDQAPAEIYATLLDQDIYHWVGLNKRIKSPIGISVTRCSKGDFVGF
jgi:hypothetical protein